MLRALAAFLVFIGLAACRAPEPNPGLTGEDEAEAARAYVIYRARQEQALREADEPAL